MLISKQGWKKSNNGKVIYKDVKDLNNSNHRVVVKCDECNREFETLVMYQIDIEPYQYCTTLMFKAKALYILDG